MMTPDLEHAVLKEDVGTWDASVETMFPARRRRPRRRASRSTPWAGNGLRLVTDFRGEMMGGQFLGHGVATWDPAKKNGWEAGRIR